MPGSEGDPDFESGPEIIGAASAETSCTASVIGAILPWVATVFIVGEEQAIFCKAGFWGFVSMWLGKSGEIPGPRSGTWGTRLWGFARGLGSVLDVRRGPSCLALRLCSIIAVGEPSIRSLQPLLLSFSVLGCVLALAVVVSASSPCGAGVLLLFSFPAFAPSSWL